MTQMRYATFGKGRVASACAWVAIAAAALLPSTSSAEVAPRLQATSTLRAGARSLVGHPAAAKRTEITAYPDFANACTAFVVGHTQQPGSGSVLLPVLGHRGGNCADNSKPLVFTMSHESAGNTHIGAANYDPHIRGYMGDLDIDRDLGRWVNFSLGNDPSGPIVSIALDTINYHQADATGWQLQYGHLFAAVSDLSARASLDQALFVEFDIRVRASEVRPELYKGYSGRRIMIGGLVNWDEQPPRANRAHFLEVDLLQSNGYTRSYGDPDYPLCRDRAYDRCWYSPKSEYPEGREIRFQSALHGPSLPLDGTIWMHVRIPLSRTLRSLPWVSPPASWHDATLSGLYIGVESEGATRTWLEVRNYHAYAL